MHYQVKHFETSSTNKIAELQQQQNKKTKKTKDGSTKKYDQISKILEKKLFSTYISGINMLSSKFRGGVKFNNID